MRVSIVTVCFNSADTIGQTIRSVQDQEYRRIEHVIIDGGSTDGTIDIVKTFNGRIKKLLSEPDEGIYDAMNKGLHLARGEVIAFLNADDVYASPTVISDVVAALRADHADGVYGDLVYVGRGNSNRVIRYWQAGEYRPRAFHRGWVPPHPTFFCRRDLYRQFGGFNPSYRIAGDFELMLRLIEKHRIRVQYIPKPLVRMRAGGRANTLRGIFQGNREIIQAFRHNDMAFPPAFFVTKFFRKARQLVRRPRLNVIP
jgi:glycosyltransferase involved in cell wall biosynthesis